MNWDLLDKQREMFGDITEDGFTQAEYAGRYKLSPTAARAQLGKLLGLGRIEFIGHRAGKGMEKAYRLRDAKTNSRARSRD
jgi:hypothetical protein